MNHCMIDLETLGTQPGSIILSIGAVLFDPTKAPHECLGEEFYYVIGKPTCLAAGLTFSQDTLDWWKKQSPEARKVLTQSEDPNESISLKRCWICCPCGCHPIQKSGATVRTSTNPFWMSRTTRSANRYRGSITTRAATGQLWHCTRTRRLYVLRQFWHITRWKMRSGKRSTW